MAGSGMALGLIGGLGLFLYGMHLMSISLEKVAGAKLRGVLELFTKNRFIGIIVGIIFTGIVQSSSATTVMVVGFVNAGLMNLYQAAGVIYGANIGTTVTSQLVSFDLSEYAPVFIMIGVIMALFIKNTNVKKIGEVIIGFGILFLGLSTMAVAMSSLKEAPEVMNLLASLDSHIAAVLFGLVITSILQSSSVTVSIILLMATQGLLELSICFFIIMGCNIGSCASALLASIGGKKDAVRAALIHFLFNVFGTIIIYMILTLGLNYVEDFIRSISGGDIGRCVANAHTIFKVFQVVILLPFSNGIVKLTYKIIPGEDRKTEQAELKYIGEDYIVTSNTAIPQVIKEMNRMGQIAIENLDAALMALLTNNEKEAKKVLEVEQTIDYLDHEITQYLIQVNQLNLPVSDRESLGKLFYVASDIERIGDHAENIAEDALRKKEQKITFSDIGDTELIEMKNMVDEILQLSLEMFSMQDSRNLNRILELENSIDHEEYRLQNNHIERLNENKCTAQAGMMFSDLLSNLERIADHAINIAFSILDYNPEEQTSNRSGIR